MIYPNPAKDVETTQYPYAELFRDFAAADAKTAARSRIPLPKVHAAPPSLRVRVRAGSAATG
jgi:hypothetical protein